MAIQKIGVIGAGPAGLSVAQRLLEKGHGVTLYEALCGRRPYPGDSLEELRQAVDGSELRQPRAGRSIVLTLARTMPPSCATSTTMAASAAAAAPAANLFRRTKREVR